LTASRKEKRLDALNFFLADVRGGLGPYVSVFLLTEALWTQAEIGTVLTISGILGIAFQAPIGAFIDATHGKRGLLVASVLLLAASAIAIERVPIGPVVLAADIVMAILGAVFAPTIAAITLGMVEPHRLAGRLGRNTAFERAGNLFIAVIVGFVGWQLSQRAVFYVVPLFAFLSVAVILSIPANAIDHARARGFEAGAPSVAPLPWWQILFDCRPFAILAAILALFHFANAAMLPLVAQKLALANPGQETLFTAACLIVAQLATIPAAMVAGRKADIWGRRPLLIAACAVLPVRGLLFALVDDPIALVLFQVLDGVGGGLLDMLLPLLLADVVRGSGRYNVSRGLLGTVQGVGGSLSNGFAGVLVVAAGYSVAFFALAGFAVVALAIVALAMPETAPVAQTGRPP
jgi:MFS family permease